MNHINLFRCLVLAWLSATGSLLELCATKSKDAGAKYIRNQYVFKYIVSTSISTDHSAQPEELDNRPPSAL